MAATPPDKTPPNQARNRIIWISIAVVVLIVSYRISQNDGADLARPPAGQTVTYVDLCPSTAEQMTQVQWKEYKQKYIGASANGWTAYVYDVSSYFSDYQVQALLDAHDIRRMIKFNVPESDSAKFVKDQRLEVTGTVKEIEGQIFGNGCGAVILERVTWK